MIMSLQKFTLDSAISNDLHLFFGECLRLNENLARYTSARVGGAADALVEVDSSAELAQAASWLWERKIPFFILGGGSNILVSDSGVRGVVILNHARQVHFEDNDKNENPQVWAESGANFSAIARQAARRSLAGLEWASGIPGTIGGAVVGNAGAHGEDIAGNLFLAEILQPTSREGKEHWKAEDFEFSYRNSFVKRNYYHVCSQPAIVILEVILNLMRSEYGLIQSKVKKLTEYRRKTQPPGSSMGSMFKNPPGDFAGRLIDAAGLKGVSVGKAQISPLHANFFINHGGATADDIRRLLVMAEYEVENKFGIKLEREVELVGDWE